MERRKILDYIYLIPFAVTLASLVVSTVEYYLISSISYSTYRYWMENISIPILLISFLAGIPRMYYMLKNKNNTSID